MELETNLWNYNCYVNFIIDGDVLNEIFEIADVTLIRTVANC
jgi:hypothetical protein